MMFFFMVVICLLLGSFQAQSRPIEDISGKSSEEIDNSTERDDKSVSAIIERANKHAGHGLNNPSIMFGDIAVATGLERADDPCTGRGCIWERSKSGKVLVPYVLSDEYSSQEKDVIFQGLRSFEESTCIRFTPRTNQRDYINIESNSGCYSFVGRRTGGQTVSLDRDGCISLNIVQHELLHTLGFHHEHNRSDRDNHVKILFKNIIPGQEYNFDKIKSKNLETAYDYSSVMHYGRFSHLHSMYKSVNFIIGTLLLFAFSKNREPTIIPIPDNNVSIGRAVKMSSNDILRINKLYCSVS